MFIYIISDYGFYRGIDRFYMVNILEIVAYIACDSSSMLRHSEVGFMIAILCKDMWRAKQAFELFMQVLMDNEPYSITRVWSECNCVETDSDLKYIFIDYRMEPMFQKMKADIINEDEFLFGIEDVFEIEMGRF